MYYSVEESVTLQIANVSEMAGPLTYIKLHKIAVCWVRVD